MKDSYIDYAMSVIALVGGDFVGPGTRGVGFAALLGLDDFRKHAFATGYHADLLQRKYPHAEIAFSCPRLRPIINNDRNACKWHEQTIGADHLKQLWFMYIHRINTVIVDDQIGRASCRERVFVPV